MLVWQSVFSTGAGRQRDEVPHVREQENAQIDVISSDKCDGYWSPHAQNQRRGTQCQYKAANSSGIDTQKSNLHDINILYRCKPQGVRYFESCRI